MIILYKGSKKIFIKDLIIKILGKLQNIIMTQNLYIYTKNDVFEE